MNCRFTFGVLSTWCVVVSLSSICIVEAFTASPFSSGCGTRLCTLQKKEQYLIHPHSGISKQIHQVKHLSKSNRPRRKKVKLQFVDCAVAAAHLNQFLHTSPLTAATIIGGLKATIADGLVQFHENRGVSKYNRKFRFCFRRNASCVIYSAFVPGLIAAFVYNKVFPILFGINQSLELNLFKAFFDNFIIAPLCWLPPAYMINSLILRKASIKTGLQNYLTDVRDKGLLTKYWLLWIPVQIINFTLVPAHLVVSFMAFISFFWTIVLSSTGSTT